MSVVATSDGPARVDLSIQVGEDPMEVVYLQLHDDVIAPFLDIPALMTSIEAFAGVGLPEAFSGRVTAELRQEGSTVTSGRFAIEEDIAIGDTNDDIGFQFAADLEPGWIRMDGAAMTLDGGLDLGAVDLRLPWSEEEDASGESVVTKHLEVDLPAFHGSLAFDGAQDTVFLSDAGIGDRTTDVNVDGNRIIGVDVNPLDGRRFDMVLTAPSEGDIQVTVSPVLDVQVEFAMHHVQDDMEDELPDVLADATIGVLLDDAEAPAIRTRPWTGTPGSRWLGTLTLWSAMMEEDVVITEGMCIDTDVENGHDLCGGLHEVPCAD